VSKQDLGPDLGQAVHHYHISEDGGVMIAFMVQRMAKLALADWGSVCLDSEEGVEAVEEADIAGEDEGQLNRKRNS
jgi:hypothetical protein